MNKFFYSNKCIDCQLLWRVITDKNLNNIFTPISLDGMTVNEIKSLKLKIVPTIISLDGNKLSVHEGKQKCKSIIDQLIRKNLGPANFGSANMGTGNIANVNNIGTANMGNANNQVQPVNETKEKPEYNYETKYYEHDNSLEYCEQEIDGIGDCYSYNDDNYQPRNYVKVGEEEKNITPLSGSKIKDNLKYTPNITENALTYNPHIPILPHTSRNNHLNDMRGTRAPHKVIKNAKR
jgi:hypothetical protein